MLKLSHIAQSVGASIAEDLMCTGVSIDTRTLMPGDIFVALKGAQCDGHDFIPDAISKGAQACVVSRPLHFETSVPCIQVPNTYEALVRMAAYHRAQFTYPIIALTGSCGKTTTKEMIASILREKFNTFATLGNRNSDVGVPLTLLNLTREHEVAVVELGANHPGEIAANVSWVKPHIALILNVAPAHLEGFQTLEGVARAKSEIFTGLSDAGTAVYNADDLFAPFWKKQCAGRPTITFGLASDADVQGKLLEHDPSVAYRFLLKTPQGSCEVQLHVPGEHNVMNALAAATVGVLLDVPLEKIKCGLERATTLDGRMQFQKGLKGAHMIDDTYNANPRSVEVALNVLMRLKGRRILVLGDLAELGSDALRYHHEIGELASRLGIDLLLSCGVLSFHTHDAFQGSKAHFSKKSDLIEALKLHLDEDAYVLIKGSRSAGMDAVVHGILQKG